MIVFCLSVRVRTNMCFLRDAASHGIITHYLPTSTYMISQTLMIGQCRCDWQGRKSIPPLPPWKHSPFCSLGSWHRWDSNIWSPDDRTLDDEDYSVAPLWNCVLLDCLTLEYKCIACVSDIGMLFCICCVHHFATAWWDLSQLPFPPLTESVQWLTTKPVFMSFTINMFSQCFLIKLLLCWH